MEQKQSKKNLGHSVGCKLQSQTSVILSNKKIKGSLKAKFNDTNYCLMLSKFGLAVPIASALLHTGSTYLYVAL